MPTILQSANQALSRPCRGVTKERNSLTQANKCWPGFKLNNMLSSILLHKALSLLQSPMRSHRQLTFRARKQRILGTHCTMDWQGAERLGAWLLATRVRLLSVAPVKLQSHVTRLHTIETAEAKDKANLTPIWKTQMSCTVACLCRVSTKQHVLRKCVCSTLESQKLTFSLPLVCGHVHFGCELKLWDVRAPRRRKLHVHTE